MLLLIPMLLTACESSLRSLFQYLFFPLGDVDQAMGTCRRKMIAEALGEQGGEGMCTGGCDICAGDAGAFITIDATRHASTLVR